MKLEVKNTHTKKPTTLPIPSTGSPGIPGSLVRKRYRIDEEGAVYRLYGVDSKVD